MNTLFPRTWFYWPKAQVTIAQIIKSSNTKKVNLHERWYIACNLCSFLWDRPVPNAHLLPKCLQLWNAFIRVRVCDERPLMEPECQHKPTQDLVRPSAVTMHHRLSVWPVISCGRTVRRSVDCVWNGKERMPPWPRRVYLSAHIAAAGFGWHQPVAFF